MHQDNYKYKYICELNSYKIEIVSCLDYEKFSFYIEKILDNSFKSDVDFKILDVIEFDNMQYSKGIKFDSFINYIMGDKVNV